MVEDLVTHLRTSDACYRAALPAEFLDRNPPPMYITLYFIVTHLPDSLRAVLDHFLALDPTDLTINLLEKHLLAAETSVVAIGATRCTPRTPFFEGCSPSYASAAAVDFLGAADVGAASALSGKRRSSKGKGGRSGGGGSGGGSGGGRGGGGGSGGGGSGGSGGGSVGFGGGGGGSSGGGGSPVGVVLRGEFGDEAECPWWAELLRSGVDIFDLDYDAILAAVYALSASAEGDCYLCVPPDPGIEAAGLGASESALPGTAPAKALAQVLSAVSFVRVPPSLHSLHMFRSDWLTPKRAQLLPIPPLFSRVQRFRSAHSQVFTSPRSLQTWSSRSPPLVLAPVAPDSPVAPPPLSPLPATPSWHALPPPCLWSSQVSASPTVLACPALPSLRQGAAARRSSLLLVSPNNCSPADSPHGRVEVPDVLIPWIHAVRLQLRERFGEDLSVLRMHSDTGGEFSSDLLRNFCRGEDILQSFTLPASPQQNGIAKRRIVLDMELNLWPRVSLPETSPTLCWTGKVGHVSVFRVWGSRALVRDTSADKLSSRNIPCVFLGFPPDAPCWQFYHPTSRRVLPSQDVTPTPRYLLVEVAIDSGAARGVASGSAEPVRAEPGGAEPAGAEPGGAEPEGAEPTGAESEGVEFGGAVPRVCGC
ncbi:unnamed protein product [Closterium sp. NIES-53]